MLPVTNEASHPAEPVTYAIDPMPPVAYAIDPITPVSYAIDSDRAGRWRS